MRIIDMTPSKPSTVRALKVESRLQDSEFDYAIFGFVMAWISKHRFLVCDAV
jgi:hypothetical protein